MKAWRLDRLGGNLRLQDVPVPSVRPGSVAVRVHASMLLSYLKPYVEGKLTFYSPPPGEFTIGAGGVGVIDSVGQDVWHLKVGQRVVFSPHFLTTENSDDPAQILIGVTAFGRGSLEVQSDWRDGALAELALTPAQTVTSIDGLESFDATQLALLNRFVIPFSGLLRGRLAAGETLVVNGATGAYGAAAVLLAVAMGSARVVAAGRDASALAAIARAGGSRVTTVQLRGDVKTDTAALRAASGGGAHIAFDQVGQAADANSTLAALNSLHRNGRLVLMGSMKTPLPLSYSDVMRNNWEIIGQFMHPANIYGRLIDLLRAGLLNIDAIQSRCFRLEELPDALEAAAKATSLESVVIQPL